MVNNNVELTAIDEYTIKLIFLVHHSHFELLNVVPILIIHLYHNQ